MRIVSLVPSATELLFALGVGDQVVAVTHECDFPAAVRELPSITRDLVGPGLSAREIDAAVREHTATGGSIYGLDADLLADLRPDLIVTQALCAVCAVSADDVRALAEDIDPRPDVLSLDPTTLGEVMADVRTLAAACEAQEAGEALVESLAGRIDAVSEAVAGAAPVGVACLEWLDPIFVAGHWTPQLVELAGGLDLLGMPGEHSEQRSWEEVGAAAPEVVVVMPCGYGTERSYEEACEYAEELLGLGARRVACVDAAAWFSRPGPRLVEGLEVLAHLLHPDRVAAPAPGDDDAPATLDLEP